MPKANTRGAADLPRAVRSCYAYRCMFQHVIARSEATWQSASPQESLPGCCCLGEFVMPYVFAEKTAFGSALLRGERIATPRRPKVRHVVAPKSAMPSSGQRPEQGNAPLGLLSPQSVPLCGAPWLCRPKARAGQRSLGAPLPAKGHPLRGPHALARNDMLKLGMCQRLQECPAWQNFPALCAGALPQFAMTGRRLGGAAGKLRRRRETLGEQLPAGNRWVKP